MELQGRIILRLPWLALLFSVSFGEFNVTSNSTDQVVCLKEHEYDDLDVRLVLGKWNVKELYLHRSKEGISVYMSCPTVVIWEVDGFPSSTFGPSTERQELHHVQAIRAQFRHEYRHLRLLWDEDGKTLEYALFFRNDSAGYWQTFDVQNGTLAARPSYQQFTGTVQVLKAVNDHLVLNFCQEANANSPAQLYSVLFSREPGQMARWEIDAVHSMLQTKKLSVSSRRMVCGNGAERQIYSVLFSLLAGLFAFVTL